MVLCGRDDPRKKRILPHHASLSLLFPAWPTITVLILQGGRKRVNVVFLHIVGGVYQR